MTARIASRIASAVAIASAFAVLPTQAGVLEQTKKVARRHRPLQGGAAGRLRCGEDVSGILAFGGGPQTMNTVDGVLNRNFRAEAEKRGYIVVAPAAPDGELFFEDGARIFPEFLKMILADYKIQDGKFHIAGPSNGGIAAFHVAAANPQYFLSVTAFPGYMWEPTTAKLQAISKMCVFMYVGENDEYRWHDEMQHEAEFLRSKGPSRATPSRKASRTGWRRSPARTRAGCSTASRRRRRAAPPGSECVVQAFRPAPRQTWSLHDIKPTCGREQHPQAFIAQKDSQPREQARRQRDERGVELSHPHVPSNRAAQIAGEQDRAEDGRLRDQIERQARQLDRADAVQRVRRPSDSAPLPDVPRVVGEFRARAREQYVHRENRHEATAHVIHVLNRLTPGA